MLPLIIGLEDGYRGLSLEDQLRSQGIEATRVAGVLLSELPEPQDTYVDQDVARILLRRNLTAGEIGCALAHREAYRQLLNSSADFALIFEDDARLERTLPVEEIRQHMESPSPRVILLDWNPGWTITYSAVFPGSTSLYSTRFAPIDARGYAVNRAAAKLLMQQESRINYVADWPAQVAGKIDFYVIYPRAVKADWTVPSTLEGSRQAQGQTQMEQKWRKVLRLAFTASHLRWLLHRRAYGGYGVYLRHELARLPLTALARRLNLRLNPLDNSSPLVFPSSMSKLRPQPVALPESDKILEVQAPEADNIARSGTRSIGEK